MGRLSGKPLAGRFWKIQGLGLRLHQLKIPCPIDRFQFKRDNRSFYPVEFYSRKEKNGKALHVNCSALLFCDLARHSHSVRKFEKTDDFAHFAIAKKLFITC